MDEMVSVKKRLSEEIQKQNDANAVQRLLDIFTKIKETIRQTEKEIEHTNSLEDKRLANARKLEDANLRLDEEKEVGVLAADDPDREKKEKAIRARYEAKSDLEAFDKRTKGTTNTKQRDAARAPLEQAHRDFASARQGTERELAQYMTANKEYLQGITALARDNKAEINQMKSRLAAMSCDASGD
jgi:hypothetical protein